MEDIHGQLRALEQRVAALEAHPAIRNMSLEGPKSSPEWRPPAPQLEQDADEPKTAPWQPPSSESDE